MGLFSSLTKPAWKRAMRRAEKAARSGDPAAAYQFYGDALDGCPDGDREIILQARQKCAAELHAVHMRAAYQLKQQGEWEEATERFELALRFAVDEDQHAAAELALRELAAGSIDREEAREVEREPDEAEPVDPQSVFVMLISDLPEAIADEYEALGEGFRGAYLTAQAGRLEEALEIYASLTASAPGSAILHFEYGNCLLALDRPEEAVEQLERAEALNLDWIEAKLALAEVAWRLKRWELAEAVLQRAVDQEQDDPRVYAAIGRTALYTKTPDYGLEATEAGLELDPTNREILLVRGQLLEMAELEDDALELYEAQVERHWRYDAETGDLVFDFDAGLLAARLYYRRGENLDRAEELTRAVVHVATPRNRWKYEVLLAEILVKAGKVEEGRSIAHEASHMIPDDEPLWRARAADLAGDEELLERLVDQFDDEQRTAWETRLAEGQND